MPYNSPSFYPIYIVGGLLFLAIICFLIWISKSTYGQAKSNPVKITKMSNSTIKSKTISESSSISPVQNANESELSDINEVLPSIQEKFEDSVSQSNSEAFVRETKILNPDIYVNPLIGRKSVAEIYLSKNRKDG